LSGRVRERELAREKSNSSAELIHYGQVRTSLGFAILFRIGAIHVSRRSLMVALVPRSLVGAAATDHSGSKVAQAGEASIDYLDQTGRVVRRFRL